MTIGSLLPGMLANVKVRNVLSDGLLVSFLTFFNGTIDCFHLTQVQSHSLSLQFMQCRLRQQAADPAACPPACQGPAINVGGCICLSALVLAQQVSRYPAGTLPYQIMLYQSLYISRKIFTWMPASLHLLG